MNENQPLIEEIKRFCEKHDFSRSGFGRRFMNNPNFMDDLENPDYEPKYKTVKRLQREMKNYKPKGKKQ